LSDVKKMAVFGNRPVSASALSSVVMPSLTPSKDRPICSRSCGIWASWAAVSSGVVLYGAGLSLMSASLSDGGTGGRVGEALAYRAGGTAGRCGACGAT
jgi:hypothetical protein